MKMVSNVPEVIFFVAEMIPYVPEVMVLVRSDIPCV